MMKMSLKLLFLVIPILLVSCISGKPSCPSQSCKIGVRRMVNDMDLTTNPCDDFHQFACGKGNSSLDSDDDELTEPFIRTSKKNQKQLISSLEKASHVNDTKPVKIAKYLYQNCLKADEQSLDPFLNILEQVGGWPVLKENKTWNETAFNWKKTIFKIGNKKHWINFFIPIKQIHDGIYLGQQSIFITEPDLKVPPYVVPYTKTIQNRKNYLKYMVDIAVKMGATEAYATEQLNDVLQFEIYLFSIKAPSTVGEKASVRYQDLLEKPVSLSELMKNFSFIPWDEYIKSQLPNNVTLVDVSDNIFVSNLNYIKDLKNLMETIPKRVVANYVIWRYVDYFAHYLNKPIRDTHRNYKYAEMNRNSTGIQESRSDDCYKFISYNMLLVLSIIYVREHYDGKIESNVNVMLNNILDEFVGSLEKKSLKMNSEIKKHSIDEVRKMTRIISYPNELLDKLMTNKYLDDLELVNEGYIGNVLNVMQSFVKFAWELLHPLEFEELLQWVGHRTILSSFDDSYYISKSNILFFAAKLLQDPSYNNDFPLHMNYGKLGYLIGHEVANALDNKEREFENIFSQRNITGEIGHESAQCILEQHLESGFTDTKEISNKNIAINRGILAAFYAYEKVSKTDSTLRINGKNYTPRQMFWISTANSMCKKLEHDIDYRQTKYRIISSFSNMKEFAEDFKCARNSPMNPSKKCHIW